MARKRSVAGRARAKTPVSSIMLQTEKINRRIRQLEKSGRYGSYKSKELIQFVKDNSNLTIKKSRGSKRHRVLVGKLRESTFGRLALIGKKFKEILTSKAFTPVGILGIEKETRVKVTTTLEGMMGKKLSKTDVELFWNIIKEKANEILEKIPPSDFYVLVMNAREENISVDSWVNMINDYVSINNQTLREAAEYLYNKFVR